MATQNSIHVPEELLAELLAEAAAEGKSLDEVARVAFQQYLDKERWQRLVASRREAARAKGLTESDVPRLIEESRRERR